MRPYARPISEKRNAQRNPEKPCKVPSDLRFLHNKHNAVKVIGQIKNVHLDACSLICTLIYTKDTNL